MPRADRLFALVQLLSGTRRRSLLELVMSLKTTARTVYRDLADLETRGVAIERGPEHTGCSGELGTELLFSIPFIQSTALGTGPKPAGVQVPRK